MPTFDFRCEKCGEVRIDHYIHSHRDSGPECCGGEMERFYSLGSQHVGASGFPFITKNIHPDGRPIEVKSPGHLRELCKIHGVVQRDDAAFINKEYQGYDFKTKKQRYKEGNGVGMKGCWV